MTSQIGGAEIYDYENKEEEEELPKLLRSSSTSPSTSELKKQQQQQQQKENKQYEPIISGLIVVWNTKPKGRAPEIDADTKEMVDKITGYIKQIIDGLKMSFDEKAYQSFINEMWDKLYTFLQQQQRGHSSKRKRMRKTVRGGTRPLLENEQRRPRQHSADPNGSQPPPDDGSIPPSSRSGSSSVSWSQHCIMLFLMMSSLFMVYIAYVKFNQTLKTVTSTETVGEIADFVREINTVLSDIENGNFLGYILRMFTSSQVDVELYYTSQFTSIIKKMVADSVKDMAGQIKSTCVGDPIFGEMKIAGLDLTFVTNTISNALGMFIPDKTTECVTNTVIALTRDQFRKIETHIALIVAKILQNQNVIRWLLSGAGVLSIPPLKFYGRIFFKNYKQIMRSIKSRRRASLPEEHGRPGSPGRELLALPPPPQQGGGRKTRSRRFLRNKKSRRVVLSGKRRN